VLPEGVATALPFFNPKQLGCVGMIETLTGNV
jgi:hypothetical protein